MFRKKNLLVSSGTLSAAITSAECCDGYFDINICSVVHCLGPHFCFSRTKDGDKNLREAVADDGRPICGTLWGEVDFGVSQFKLASAIEAKTAIVKNLRP
jgi:hypothetical protein